LLYGRAACAAVHDISPREGCASRSFECYVAPGALIEGWGRAYSAAVGSGVRGFGPAERGDIATAFEATLKDFGLADRNDPVTHMLAKITIEIAKQGQFTAASLRARILKDMKPKGRLN